MAPHDAPQDGPAPEEGAAVAPVTGELEDMLEPGLTVDDTADEAHDAPQDEPEPAADVADEEQERRAAPGCALVRAPIGTEGTVGHAGTEYEIDEQGVVELPSAALEPLVRMGFTLLSRTPPIGG